MATNTHSFACKVPIHQLLTIGEHIMTPFDQWQTEQDQRDRSSDWH